MRTTSWILMLCFVLAGAANAETEAERLMKRAEAGDADAQLRLGHDHWYGFVRYSDGSGVERDFTTAKKWLEMAASQEYPPAVYFLGELYRSRKYDLDGDEGTPAIERDHLKAASYYIKFLTLAEKREPEAEGKEREALPEMMMKAMANLGDLYFQDCDDDVGWLSTEVEGCGRSAPGVSIPQDYGRAFYWYDKAAARGQYWAFYRLGKMYEGGKGVPQNFKQAIAHYERAAEGGYSATRFALGNLYLTMGDKVAAYMWLNLAASVEEGNKAVVAKRDEVVKLLTAEEIEIAQDRARAWFEAQKK